MPISQFKRASNLKWRTKAYEQIKIFSRRENRLNDLLDYAAACKHVSKSQYIIDALNARLKADNFSIENLPPIEEDGE